MDILNRLILALVVAVFSLLALSSNPDVNNMGITLLVMFALPAVLSLGRSRKSIMVAIAAMIAIIAALLFTVFLDGTATRMVFNAIAGITVVSTVLGLIIPNPVRN